MKSPPPFVWLIAILIGVVLGLLAVKLVSDVRHDVRVTIDPSTRECLHYGDDCIVCTSAAGRDVYNPEACKRIGQ